MHMNNNGDGCRLPPGWDKKSEPSPTSPVMKEALHPSLLKRFGKWVVSFFHKGKCQ